MMRIAVGLALLGILAAGCAAPKAKVTTAGTFGDDLEFLDKHSGALVLSDALGLAQVAVSPALQGRVLTSTADGPLGKSFGWINRSLFAAHQMQAHFNPFGGEDRFWIGPEGGQFSLYFGKDQPFDLDHWYVPHPIDTELYALVSKTADSAVFRKKFTVTNYSGTKFNVEVNRTVRLLSPLETWKLLDIRPVLGVKMVAYESINEITNEGKEPWKKDTGLLSIWILGTFNPSPTTTVVIPFRPGAEIDLGKPVKDDYFGKVPAERLVVKETVAYFKADGQCRSKIGAGPRRAKGILGSYDAANHVLTLVQYTSAKGAADYVNSAWEIQKDPYTGDVINSYNDGPASAGAKPMGPFYELESSSPALALEPGKSAQHVHRTIHLVGDEALLDPIARAALGVGIKDILSALPK